LVVSPYYLASVAGEVKYGKDFRENGRKKYIQNIGIRFF
jgi:hypothetical protein